MDRYKQLVDLAPDAIVVVRRDGIIDYANLETERIFGHAPSELIGRSHDLLVPERLRAAHAEHTERFFAQPQGRPMGRGMETFGLTRDGREIPVEVSLGVIETEAGLLVATTIRDITQRRRLEVAAKVGRDRLAAALDAITDPIALIDPDDTFVAANDAFWEVTGLPKSMLGHPRAEAAAAAMAMVSFKDDGERDEYANEALVPGNLRATTRDLRMLDGRTYRMSIRHTLEGGIVIQLTDLTETLEHAAQLEKAQRDAEAASAAKSSFLSSMTHELRTPFNAIVGFAQLLYRDKREPLSDRQRQRVDQILRGAEHLLHLIDDVLDLSHIEAGGIAVSTEGVEVSEVLDGVIEALQPAADDAGVLLVRGSVPPEAAVISADRTRFTQILMNYGANAIKYNRKGGAATFTVALRDPGRVRVCVADTGVGIPDDKQEKLFQPFQRAGQEAGPIEGTGIGLAISKRLAELMSGTVGFRSAPGDGSEFWVDLPAEEGRIAHVSPMSLRAMAPSHRSGLERSLVLYVEDNPANVALMRDLLNNHEEVELATTPTAEMGLELARMKQPKLIILDINLPGMSGLEALGLLRAWPETKHIPVVALTAAATERDRQIGKAAGFYRYLTKPVKIDELEAAIESALGR